MTLIPSSELRNVPGLDDSERALICAYLQGAVYCWAKNRRGEQFSVRDLVGGENTDWDGTPLQRLYDRHLKVGKTNGEAFKAAAKDAGWIMKSILDKDNREFEIDSSGYTNKYRWREGG